MEKNSDEWKGHIHKVRSEAGKKGGKKSGPINGKILGQFIDLPTELLDSIQEKGSPYCTWIIKELLPVIVDLEELKTSFIPEYLVLLQDPGFRFVPKRAVALHRHFLERIENLVGKRNRAKFITAYLTKKLQ